jgi:hypothetical protein
MILCRYREYRISGSPPVYNILQEYLFSACLDIHLGRGSFPDALAESFALTGKEASTV